MFQVIHDAQGPVPVDLHHVPLPLLHRAPHGAGRTEDHYPACRESNKDGHLSGKTFFRSIEMAKRLINDE